MGYELQARTSGGEPKPARTYSWVCGVMRVEVSEGNGEFQKMIERDFGEKRV